ncbi:MAG: hypothetical protein KA369_10595 [Spirochaetes bacterium]|nr:hypothetical protein [Spirochaetota bacterium]
MIKTIVSYIRIRRVESMLPGANCAACGADDCRGFARMIVRERADAARCSVCDRAMIDRIRHYLKLK